MKNKEVYLVTTGSLVFCIFGFIVLMKKFDYFSKHKKCGSEICNVLFTTVFNSYPLKPLF